MKNKKVYRLSLIKEGNTENWSAVFSGFRRAYNRAIELMQDYPDTLAVLIYSKDTFICIKRKYAEAKG